MGLSRLGVIVIGIATGVGGCTAPLSYQEPVDATPRQLEAAEALADLVLIANATRRGRADPAQAFEPHSILAKTQAIAVLGSKSPIRGNGTVPPGIGSSCVGVSGTTYRYQGCETDNGTINGSIAFTPLSVDYDVQINSGPDGANAFTLHGAVNLGDPGPDLGVSSQDLRLIGTLDLRMQVDVPGSPDVGGISVGDGVGDVNTVTRWDVTFSEQRKCITAGSIEIEVEAKGEFDGTRFLFEGCDATARVQNADQLAKSVAAG